MLIKGYIIDSNIIKKFIIKKNSNTKTEKSMKSNARVFFTKVQSLNSILRLLLISPTIRTETRTLLRLLPKREPIESGKARPKWTNANSDGTSRFYNPANTTFFQDTELNAPTSVRWKFPAFLIVKKNRYFR